jgi:hypothetical protein
MEEYITVIQAVGFPIFVSLWFMLRTEKVIKANTEVMSKILLKK